MKKSQLLFFFFFIGVVVLGATESSATNVGDTGFALTQTEFDALDWKWCPEPTNDSSPNGGSTYEIYPINVAWTNSTVYIHVQTNFKPLDGIHTGLDSYSAQVDGLSGKYHYFSPGDLYLNVGGMFQNGTGTTYGIGTTDHANVVQQAYGDSWTNVIEGNLYQVSSWATGTYETYQNAISGEYPYDGDGGSINSYPTLIRQGTNLGSSASTYAYSGPNGSSPKWDLWYSVDRSAIGLVYPNQLQVFWAMECGNDGAEWKGDIPEPTTVALISAGVVAMAHRKRSRIV